MDGVYFPENFCGPDLGCIDSDRIERFPFRWLSVSIGRILICLPRRTTNKLLNKIPCLFRSFQLSFHEFRISNSQCFAPMAMKFHFQISWILTGSFYVCILRFQLPAPTWSITLSIRMYSSSFFSLADCVEVVGGAAGWAANCLGFTTAYTAGCTSVSKIVSYPHGASSYRFTYMRSYYYETFDRTPSMN